MVACPHCSTPVPRTHLAPDAGTGHCPSCDQVFVLSDAALSADPSAHVDLDHWPVGVDIVRDGPDLRVAVRWQDSHIGLPVALAGGAILVFSLGSFSLAAIPGLVLPLGMIWFGAAMSLNTTLIEVRDGRLAVHHGPLPWPGARVIRLERMGALRVVSRRHMSRRDVTVWDLLARTDLGEVTLMSGYEDERIPTFVHAVLDDQLRG